MGRPQTIYVDDQSILAAIRKAYTSQREALVKAIADRNERREFDQYWQQCHRELRELEARGIRCDLEQFAGRLLSPSERLRHQAAVRRLIAQGLVVRDGAKVKPVEAAHAS